MSSRIVLVRHAAHDLLGRAIAGRTSVPLNALGQAQALALAQRLSAERVDAVYSSPQERTRQTAAPVAAAHGLVVVIAPAFDEIDFGEWTGRSFAALEAQGEPWRHWVERRGSARPPGGEAFAAVRARAVQGVDALRLRHPDQAVVVVSHGDVIKALAATVLGLPLDDLERFEVEPASVTVIEAGAGWQRLKCLGA